MSRPPGGRYITQPEGKGWAPSVTTITNLLDKPGLSWAAAKETALFAVLHQDRWIDLSENAAIDRLRKHHAGIWDAKADIGTVVHGVALDWAQGVAVTIPPDYERYMKTDTPGQRRRADRLADVPLATWTGYLDALEAFYAEESPTWLSDERLVTEENPKGLLCEQWVAYDHPTLGYGGSFDTIGIFDNRVGLLDWKTGKRYPDALQLAGYRFSDGIAVRSPLGGVETILPWSEFPVIDFCGIVYLHDDGTYELLEVPADENAHAHFLHLRAMHNWLRDAEKWLKAHPEPKRETTEKEEKVA